MLAPRCLTTAQTRAQPTFPYPANRSPVLRPMLLHMASSTLSFNRLGEKDDCYGVTILQGVDFQNIVSVNFSLSIDPKDKVFNLKIGCLKGLDLVLLCRSGSALATWAPWWSLPSFVHLFDMLGPHGPRFCQSQLIKPYYYLNQGPPNLHVPCSPYNGAALMVASPYCQDDLVLVQAYRFFSPSNIKSAESTSGVRCDGKLSQGCQHTAWKRSFVRRQHLGSSSQVSPSL